MLESDEPRRALEKAARIAATAKVQLLQTLGLPVDTKLTVEIRPACKKLIIELPNS